MATMPGIAIGLSLDTANASSGLARFDGQVRQFSTNSNRHLSAAGSSFGSMGRTAQTSLRGISGAIAPISPGLASMAREASFAKTNIAALGVGAAAAGVAIAGLVIAVGKQATAAAELLERDSLRLEAVLRATGEAAGLTAGQIRNFADELASKTLADAPGVRKAATQLLTFKSIAGETFTRTLELAQDLSAVGFGGLEANAIRLGKALEDPGLGVSALREAGVSFSLSQRDMIASLVASGDALEAQQVILEQVAAQVGGAGAAEAGGLAGAVDSLSGNWTKFLETVGNTGPVMGATQALADLLGIINAQLSPTLEAAQADLHILEEQLKSAQQTFGSLTFLVSPDLEQSIETQRELVFVLQEQAAAERIAQDVAKNRAEEARAAAAAEFKAGKERELMGKRLAELGKQAAAEVAKAARDAQKAADDAVRETEQRRQFALAKSAKSYEELGRIGQRVADAANQAAIRERDARDQTTKTIQDQIAQQSLLLRSGGKETEEYRIQLQLLELKAKHGEEFAASQAGAIQQLEEQRTALEGLNEGAELFAKSIENALENVQDLFTDTFEQVLNDEITRFEDFAEFVRGVFVRLAAEIATLMVIRPVISGLTGPGGITDFLSLAGAGGATGLGPGQSVTPITRAGAVAGPTVSGSFLTPQVLGAGAAGIGLGTIGGGLIGGSPTGSLIGASVGAIAGGAIGTAVPIIGTAIGAFAGGALGGLVGGFFGGGDSPGAANDTGSLRFGTGRGSPFDPGVFGSLTIGGERAFAGPLRDLVRQFDEGVSQFLTGRQRELARRAVQSLEQFEGRFPESDPSEGFAEILRQRGSAVLSAAFPGARTGRVLGGASSVEEIGRRIEVALQTIRTFNELTGQTATPAQQLEDALGAIRDQFAQIRPIARALGLDVGDLNKAMREQLKTAREQFVSIQQQERIQARAAANTRQAFVDQLRAFRPLSIDQALALQLREIDRQFFALRQTARELGVDLGRVTAAHRAAARAARERAEAARRQRASDLRARRDTLGDRAIQIRDTFDNLLSPLRAFQLELRTAGASPAAAFEELQRQFFQVQGQALSGNIAAIQQLPGIGDALIQAAEQFGASPQRASTIETVQAALARVIDRTEDAQERALADLGRIMQRADANNTSSQERQGELIRQELRQLRRAVERIGAPGRVA